ncbi:MAG: DMT family transporter [Eubacterium sp.]
MKKSLTKTPVVCILALICCLLWGSAFSCVKIGYRLWEIASDDTASKILFAGNRFLLAGILTIFIGSLTSHKFIKPQADSFVLIIKLCFLQTVIHYIFFYIGLANTSGVKSSILESTSVFASILIASLLLKMEKLTSAKIAGCVLGFAGIILLNLSGLSFDSSFSLFGEGFIILSAIMSALSSIFLKRYSKYENPVVLSGYQFVLGGLILIIIGFMMGGRFNTFSLPAILMLIYLAFVSSVAYSLWGILLKYNPVSKIAIFSFMNPVFGVLLSAVLLGETTQALDYKNFIALILVCFGIYIVNKKN